MQKNIIASGVATAGVALGIGAAALTFGTGTAIAAPSDSDSSNSSSADSSASDRDKDSDTSTDDGAESGPSSNDDAAESDADQSDEDEAPVADEAAADDEDVVAEEPAADDEVAEEPAAQDEAIDDVAEVPAADPDTDAPAEPDVTDSDDTPEPVQENAVEVVSTTTDRVDGIKVPEAPTTPAPTLPDVPPTTPVEFFNWIGAQVQRTFFNRTPTASPVQFVQTDKGQIVGQVGADDFEGDKLVYTLVEGPTRGTLVLAEDGSYTYTPNASLIAEGGADSFKVEVSDIGWHLHLFNGTGTTSATVVMGVKSDSDVDTDLTSTRGFNIYNLSAENMVFKGYTKGGNRVDSGPAVGAVIAPGSNAHVEVVFRFFDDDEVTAQFSTGNQGDVTAWMLVTSVDGESMAACRGSYCSPNTEYYQDTSTIVFLDAPGTKIEIPAGEGQRQAEVLNRLCGDSSQATCSFDAKSQEQLYAPGKQVSPMMRNPTDERQSIAHQVSETEGYSDSLGGTVKFGAKLTEAINMEITATYNHTWTTSHTWSDTVTITVPPWTEASIWAENPFNRVHGDLTVTMGNTEWILRDVYFDTPNPSDLPVYTPHYEPIAHEEMTAELASKKVRQKEIRERV